MIKRRLGFKNYEFQLYEVHDQGKRARNGKLKLEKYIKLGFVLRFGLCFEIKSELQDSRG